VIPIYRPWLGEEEAAATRAPILSGWVTQGPEVARFESEFAEFVGAPDAVAVANCTVALHLALHLAGVGPGDEVVTVSHSFIATANAVRYTGATPVFVDVQADTFNLDPELVGAAISDRTRAILVVHQIGMPADLHTLVALARQHRLALVEDAACAVGSEILWDGEWQRIGRPHGDIACFSFHPRKLLTTGDGGMLTCRNPEWAQRARLLRQHGMSVPDTVRHGSPQVTFEEYSEVGFNYRMTDIQAAVGRVQLGRLPALLRRRREQADWYRKRLAGLGCGWQREPEWARSNWQSLALRLPPGADQRRVMQALLDRGVSTRRGIMCAHREPAYAAGAGSSWKAAALGASEAAQDQTLLIPLFHDLSESEMERVAVALEETVAPCCR
jgi:perosamine synthetase